MLPTAPPTNAKIKANNIITGNHTLKPDSLREGLGKQEASEGAGIALLSESRAYVGNNLICDNRTDAGRTRPLGVSNVSLRHLLQMEAAGAERPAFVQNRCFARVGWDRTVRGFCA